jgi:hypothetical protein
MLKICEILLMRETKPLTTTLVVMISEWFLNSTCLAKTVPQLSKHCR